MTVKDLMAALSNMPPQSQVVRRISGHRFDSIDGVHLEVVWCEDGGFTLTRVSISEFLSGEATGELALVVAVG